MVERKNIISSEMVDNTQKSGDVSRANPKIDSPKVPMDEYRAEVVECVLNNQSAVIIGETGSGKTTRIPFFCLSHFWKQRLQ